MSRPAERGAATRVNVSFRPDDDGRVLVLSGEPPMRMIAPQRTGR